MWTGVVPGQEAVALHGPARVAPVPESTVRILLNVRVRIRWKLIWEEGVVTVGRPGDPQAEVPYAITVGLRFDKDTEDVT